MHLLWPAQKLKNKKFKKQARGSFNSQASNLCKNGIVEKKNCPLFSLAKTMGMIVVFIILIAKILTN